MSGKNVVRVMDKAHSRRDNHTSSVCSIVPAFHSVWHIPPDIVDNSLHHRRAILSLVSHRNNRACPCRHFFPGWWFFLRLYADSLSKRWWQNRRTSSPESCRSYIRVDDVFYWTLTRLAVGKEPHKSKNTRPLNRSQSNPTPKSRKRWKIWKSFIMNKITIL